MKNKLMKIISIMLVVVVIASLSGCGNLKTVTESTTTEVVEIEGESDQNETSSEDKNSEGDATNDEDVTNNGASNDKKPNKGDSDSKDNTGTASEKKLTGKLELQIFVNGSDNNVVWENVINAFEEANPDLKVTTRIGTNVNTQLATRWMEGNPPDLVLLGGSGMDTTTYIESGLLMDLSKFLKTATVWGTKEKIIDKIKPNAITKVNNKIYEAPLTLTGHSLWYDAAYFKEKGLNVPHNYDDLMKLADKSKSLGIGAITYPGTSGAYLEWGLIMPAVAAYGQDFFDKVCSGEDPDVYKTKQFKAVMQRFINLAQKDGGFMNGTVGINHIQSQMQWLNHKAALVSSGSWLESEMKDDIPYGFKMETTYASLATKDQKETAVLMSGGVAVAQKAKNPDNAKEFIRFLYQDEYLIDQMESYGYLSACDVNTDSAKLSATTKQMIKRINSVNVVYKTKLMQSSFDNEFRNVINSVVLGDIKDVNVACDRLYKIAKKNAGK